MASVFSTIYMVEVNGDPVTVIKSFLSREKNKVILHLSSRRAVISHSTVISLAQSPSDRSSSWPERCTLSLLLTPCFSLLQEADFFFPRQCRLCSLFHTYQLYDLFPLKVTPARMSAVIYSVWYYDKLLSWADTLSDILCLQAWVSPCWPQCKAGTTDFTTDKHMDKTSTFKNRTRS